MLKVSAILAVKNGEEFLADAIHSVLCQQHQPFEVIVVDGQSDDKTPEIVQSFSDVRYIRQSGKGIGDAWNLGIENAKGEILAFLSCDDLWMPEKLLLQVHYLMEHPEIQYTTAKVKFFLEPGYSLPSGFRKDLLERDPVGYIMETLVVQKFLFGCIGTFNTTLTSGEDVDWFCRARDFGIPMAVIPKVLVHKRIHDGNLSLNTVENNHNLLTVLKQSLDRKRN